MLRRSIGSRATARFVDVMVASGQVRFLGRRVLEVPGARSAVRRAIGVEIATGLQIRMPDLSSALSLKGAALQTDGSARVRHAQDGITLFACAARSDISLSKSMRANVNHMIGELENPHHWLSVPAATRLSAIRGVRNVRPGWIPPVAAGGRGAGH